MNNNLIYLLEDVIDVLVDREGVGGRRRRGGHTLYHMDIRSVVNPILPPATPMSKSDFGHKKISIF